MGYGNDNRNLVRASYVSPVAPAVPVGEVRAQLDSLGRAQDECDGLVSSMEDRLSMVLRASSQDGSKDAGSPQRLSQCQLAAALCESESRVRQLNRRLSGLLERLAV